MIKYENVESCSIKLGLPLRVEPDKYSNDETTYCDNGENRTAETLYGVVTRLGICSKENCPLRAKGDDN